MKPDYLIKLYHPIKLITLRNLVVIKSKQDASKQDASKQDASKQDASKQDASKQDANRQDVESINTQT
jgi:hypothetical protein